MQRGRKWKQVAGIAAVVVGTLAAKASAQFASGELFPDVPTTNKAVVATHPAPPKIDPTTTVSHPTESTSVGATAGGTEPDTTVAKPPRVVRKPRDPKDAKVKPPVMVAPKVKVAAPDQAKQASALKDIQDVFRAEYADKKSESRQALAHKLLTQGRETKTDDGMRYVLFREAATLAAQGGDVDAAMEAVDEIGSGYLVDAETMRGDVLETARAASPRAEAQVAIAQAYGRMAQAAIGRDDYVGAVKLINKANVAAGASREAPTIAEFQRRVADITRIQAESVKLAAARKKLEESPEDGPANVSVGKFLCLLKRDLDAGLPYLAKGDDAGLKAIAAAELATDRKTAETVALADKWFDWAEKQELAYQKGARLHAADLYRQMLPALSGFDQKRLETRIAKVEADYGEKDKVIDLLAAVKGDKNTYLGGWMKVDNTLVTKRVAASYVLDANTALPMSPQGDYEVAVQFVAEQGYEIFLSLPVGNHHVNAILAASSTGYRYYNGLYISYIKGSPYDGVKELSVRDAEIRTIIMALTDRKPHTLYAKVITKGEVAGIQLKLDGREYAIWQGPIADLTPYWSGTPVGTIGIGAYNTSGLGQVTIQRAGLHMLNGEARPTKVDPIRRTTTSTTTGR